MTSEISDFIRKQYDHEIDRQDKIVSSLSLPTGILTALGTAGATMIWGFSYQLANITPAFYVLTAFDVVSFVFALHFLKNAFFGQTYEYLPRLFELNAYHDGLVAYYIGQGQTQEAALKTVESEFQEYLAGKMIKAGTKNAINNDEKAGARYKANWSVYAVLIFTGLMVIPYAIDARYRKPDVPTVHVDNLDSTLRQLENGRTETRGAPPGTGTNEADRAGKSIDQGRNGGNRTRPAD